MDFTQGFSSCIPFQVRSKLSHRDAHHVCSLPEGQRGSSVLPLITLDMVYEMVIWAFQWIRMCCTRRQKGMFQKCLRRSLFTLNETQKHLSLKEWTTLCPFGWTTNLGEHEPSVLLKWLVVPNYFNPRLSKVSGIHKGHSSSGVKEQCEEPRGSERHSSELSAFARASSALELCLVPTQRRFPSLLKPKPMLGFQSFSEVGQQLKTSLGILLMPSGQKDCIYNCKLSKARSHCLVLMPTGRTWPHPQC